MAALMLVDTKIPACKGFRFATLTLDLNRFCLDGPSGKLNLRPKCFEVLRYLLEHAGQVVEKDEIIKAVWPNVIVTDESLTHCISEIRRNIGDESKSIIKTVPKLSDKPFSTG